MIFRSPFDDPQPLIERVYAYVAYRVGDGADAEDVTAAVMERAFRYRDRYDDRRGNVVPWLIGIARREISEHFAPRAVPVAEVDDEIAPGELESDTAANVDLRRAVMALGERERELIALRYGADLTSRQIGELLGMRTNAVEVAVHRALASLRQLLDPREQSEPSTRVGT